MAEEIDAILVKIGIQIKEFQKGFEKVEDLLDDYKKNISDVGKKVEETSSKMQDKLADTAKKTSEVVKESFNKTEIAADKAKKSVDSLGDSTKKAGEKASKSSVDFKSFEKTLDAVGKKSTDIGKQMGAKITIPTTIVGGLATKSFVDFEKEILKIKAYSNATEPELKKLEQAVLDLSKTTEYGSTISAKALFILSDGGLSATDSIKLLPKVANLATAGLIGLEDAAKIADDAMDKLGLSADDFAKLSDNLIVVAKRTGATVQDVGIGISKVGLSAKTTDQKMTDIVATLGILSDMGVDARDSGIALNKVFLKLSNTSESAKKMLEKFNIAITDSDGKLKKLPDLIDEFQSKLQGLSETEKLDVLSEIFDPKTALVFINLLDQGSKGIRSISKDMEKQQGIAKNLADEIRKGLGVQFSMLANEVKDSLIKAFKLIEPEARKIIAMISDLIKWFDGLPNSVKKSIIVFASLLAVVSPILIAFGTMASLTSSAISGFTIMAGVIGKVATALKGLNLATITTYFTTLGTQIATVSASFYAMLAPLAAIALKIAVVITALLLVVNAGMTVVRHWDELVDYAQEIWGNISSYIKEKISGVVKYISNYLSNLYDDWAYIWDSMGQTVSDVWQAMTTPIAKVANWIKDKVQKVIVGALNLMIKTYNGVVDVLGMGEKIAIFDSFDEVAGMTSEAWSNVKKATKKGVQEVIDTTTDIAKGTLKVWKDWGATFADETSKNYEQVKRMLGLMDDVKVAGPEAAKPAPAQEEPAAQAQTATGGGDFFGDLLSGTQTKIDQLKTVWDSFWAYLAEARMKAIDQWTQDWLGFSITFEALVAKMQESTRSMWQAFTDGFATAVSNTLVLGKSFKEQMTELWKSLAAMAVKALVQIAIQAIVSNLIIAAASKKSGAVGVKVRAGEAYAGALASMSAAPWPINLGAPAFASAMSGMALGGGLAMVGSAERGGIITRHGMVEVGEKNKREAIIPLEGSEALGGARNQTIVVELNERILMETVVRGMPEHIRLKTGSHI